MNWDVGPDVGPDMHPTMNAASAINVRTDFRCVIAMDYAMLWKINQVVRIPASSETRTVDPTDDGITNTPCHGRNLMQPIGGKYCHIAYLPHHSFIQVHIMKA